MGGFGSTGKGASKAAFEIVAKVLIDEEGRQEIEETRDGKPRLEIELEERKAGFWVEEGLKALKRAGIPVEI